VYSVHTALLYNYYILCCIIAVKMCDENVISSFEDIEVVDTEGSSTIAELRPAPTYPECSMSASFVGSNCPGLIGVTSSRAAGQPLESEVSRGLMAVNGNQSMNPYLVSSCSGRTSPGRTGGLRPSAARLGTEGPPHYSIRGWGPQKVRGREGMGRREEGRKS